MFIRDHIGHMNVTFMPYCCEHRERELGDVQRQVVVVKTSQVGCGPAAA